MKVVLSEQLAPLGGWRSPGRVRLAPLSSESSTRSQRMLMRVINKVGRLEASNLFLMLMRNFRLFWNWLMFAKCLMPFGALPRRDTELVILRVGWNCRCRYEWGQHVDIGLRAGLNDEDIARTPLGSEAIGWLPYDKALMQAREVWAAVMLIGDYAMLAGVLNSTGLPLDTRLEGVLAAAPIHKRQNHDI